MIALLLIVSPILIRSPEVHLRLLVETPLKMLEPWGLVPLAGILVLLLAAGALWLGSLAHPRTQRLALVGLITGTACLALLAVSLVLSRVQGRLWLPGFDFLPPR
jgi:hypothetical protein